MEHHSREALEQQEAQGITALDRANRAKRIIEDDIFREAMQAVRDRVWKEFKEADPGDVKALQLARLRQDVAEDFLTIFARHIQTGEFAEKDVPRVRALLEAFRR